MSHPLRQAGHMKSKDAAEPIESHIAEFKRCIDEWEGIAAHIVQLLKETADCAAAENWRPHAAQITVVVTRFRQLCRRESLQFSLLGQDGLAADEAYERVWDEADGLVKWLKRMMQP